MKYALVGRELYTFHRNCWYCWPRNGECCCTVAWQM